ncbi:MAG: hypothetical protein HC906_14330 [Bacteroidales bacterium]|nr:hypothetical protein [Bacteroidales bacterium]
MSGAVSGNGSPVNLNPGTDVYFRTKATSSAFSSSNSTLDVPSRPSSPNYSIHYGEEKTNENVSSDDEYSTNSDMSGSVSGSDSKLDLNPGTNVYFRKKATGSAFESGVQTLIVPSRPSAPTYTLNPANYMTNENIPSTTQYSANQSNWSNGTGAKLQLTAGIDMYFRYAATSSSFVSLLQHLQVPVLGAPSYTINYSEEKTTENVSPEDEYSTNLSSWTTGNNTKLSLIPGTTVYFRKKADITKQQTLPVPSKNPAPTFAVDFVNERISSAVSTDFEYADDQNMTGAQTGSGNFVSLTPGTNKYLRQKSTSNSFASLVQTLTVPSRPATPSYSISYSNERTNEAVSSSVEYALNSEMTSALGGANSTLTLTPGIHLFFRVKSTNASFASGVFHLDVAVRPSTPKCNRGF